MKRILLIMTVAAAVVAVMLWVPRIPQNPAYHRFADQRGWSGMPNAMDVLSNIPLVAAGVWGLMRRRRDELTGMVTVLCGALTLTGFGSAYYHWRPVSDTMVWDRLPLAMMFMAFFAVMIADRVSLQAGRRWFWPLVVCGALSVVYWHFTDDLRWYALVQFGPMLVLPIMVMVLTGRFTRDREVWMVLGWYVLAKVFEMTDAPVFGWTHYVSGHTLKHLCAGVAAWSMVKMLTKEQTDETQTCAVVV